ncbi:phosphatidylethanolamine-binding protein 4 [Melanerpes formicivorus]|uniref:phosphatidylethanolamine-binding protein 4 n=1 Tax=Melanerpes formicivorus TaxID=211600 RepID=UPI00358E7009
MASSWGSWWQLTPPPPPFFLSFQGADLRSGDIKGQVLTAYSRPSPPPRTGYHRYQLLLYQQPAQEAIALSPQEQGSRGAWPMESFVERFQLGSPVASTQFLTKHYED